MTASPEEEGEDWGWGRADARASSDVRERRVVVGVLMVARDVDGGGIGMEVEEEMWRLGLDRGMRMMML